MDTALLNMLNSNKELINKKSLKEIIEERKIIKTKLKLIQIYYLDQALIEMSKCNLDIKDFNLNNIYLTNSLNLYIPIKNLIIPKENNSNIINSYLIYLSYLYNYNFYDLYYIDKEMFLKIFNELNISIKLKNNLYNILNNEAATFFSETIEELNNAKYREQLQEDELKLQRLKKM